LFEIFSTGLLRHCGIFSFFYFYLKAMVNIFGINVSIFLVFAVLHMVVVVCGIQSKTKHVENTRPLIGKDKIILPPPIPGK